MRFAFVLIISSITTICTGQVTNNAPPEKTMFQTSGEWKLATDVRSDVAIVYGTNDRKNLSFEQRVLSWRDHGYTAHFMTGIAWGDYGDYFNGNWDGKTHWEDGQLRLADGDAGSEGVRLDTLWHHKGVPYIVPSPDYIKYMKEQQVKRAINVGINSIYLEEPEFWARSGYSQSFRREWENYYGTPWKPQHQSPENTWLSNKLKYHLYFKALKEVFTFAKDYGKTRGMDVKCYVPTHSLLNYSTWRIISPEASLASLDCVDGYIGQVWTGTARTENYFNGTLNERTFETAWLEYNCLESMVKPTGRKMIFLTDPIEDNAKDWSDYKVNYQATFAAQLLFPNVKNYEVMPWPDRIYQGLYTNPLTGTKERIPAEYATQVQVMINTLSNMPEGEGKLSGPEGIGVFMENSLMFQGYPSHNNYEDKKFSTFFGQTMPLVKRGVPVEIIHLENTDKKETWMGLKVAVLSYSNMKPMSDRYHNYIAEWVGSGGVLIYCSTDSDPFQGVREWWNTGTKKYKTPSGHLFSIMGMPEEAKSGEYRFKKGKVIVIRKEPGDFVLNHGRDGEYLAEIQKAYEWKAGKGKFVIRNNFFLERGQYIIAAVMDETENNAPLELKGLFIDLFDPLLPVINQKTINAGEQSFLLDLSKTVKTEIPAVLCGASRVSSENYSGSRYSFTVKSPINTMNVSRVYLPCKPIKIVITDNNGERVRDASNTWNEPSKTCLVEFPNSPDGIKIEIDY